MIHHAYGRTIQERGLYPAHLFSVYPFTGTSVFPAEDGMVQAMPVGVGFALLACLLLWGYLRFLGRKFLKEQEGSEKKYVILGDIGLGFSVLAMWMSLSSFPWNRIQSLHRVTATLVSSLQFPERTLMIAGIGAVLVAGGTGLLGFPQTAQRLEDRLLRLDGGAYGADQPAYAGPYGTQYGLCQDL